MKKCYEKEQYEISQITSNCLPIKKVCEAWDYGRKNLLPLWTEFVISACQLPGGYRFTQTHCSMTSFELLLDGDMTISIEENCFRLIPGDMAIIPAGKTKKIEVTNNCSKAVFGICGQLHQSLLAMSGLATRPIIHFEQQTVILDLLNTLFILLKNKSNDTIAKIAGLSMEIIMVISQQADKTPDPLLADILRYMEFNLGQEITVAHLAKKFHVTPDRLNRTFLTTLGIPPKHYLIEQRMEQASLLLKNSELTVQEISQRIGYKNQFSFSREFRKKFNLAPYIFRQQMQSIKKI